jgi:hypothetical protein
LNSPFRAVPFGTTHWDALIITSFKRNEKN